MIYYLIIRLLKTLNQILLSGQAVLLLVLLCMWHHLSAFRFLYRNKIPF